MAVREILKMGDARLLRIAQPVPADMFDSDALHLLVADLFDTMRAVNGAGLAAPQIGIDLQLVIFGSGNRIKFPTPRLLQGLIHKGIGVDTMDNGAACRTFNVLAGEGRRVLMALLPLA